MAYKGHIPWNKGKKGVQIAWNKGSKGIMKPNKTSFKKGDKALNPFKKGCTPWNKGTVGIVKGYWTGKKGILKKNSGSFTKGSTTGDKNYNWKGGITSERNKLRTSFEYNYWRKQCMLRDNFTCQKTGISGGDLVVHHINNFADFPELRFAIDNGITLSEKAHLEFHKKYGYKNNTKEQLEEFLNFVIGQNS